MNAVSRKWGQNRRSGSEDPRAPGRLGIVERAQNLARELLASDLLEAGSGARRVGTVSSTADGLIELDGGCMDPAGSFVE